MIDLNEIKQRIIDSLTAEMYGMRSAEADFLRKLGYHQEADELNEWEVYLPQMDGSENLLRESFTPTRLERQARGDLKEIEVGDYVVELDSYPDQRWVWRVDSIDPARKVTLNNGKEVDIEKRIDIVGNGFIGSAMIRHYRLATPQELLDAGLIDEIPVVAKSATTDERPTVDEWVEENQRKEDPPRDANGEELKIGDLVIHRDFPGLVRTVTGFEGYTHESMKGKVCVLCGSSGSVSTSWKKVKTLTHEQYIPLARRTMDPDLMGDHPAAKKARLAKLALGTLGEAMEVITTSEGKTLEECGDLIWYAEQLQEEVGEPERSETVNFGAWEWSERVKKAAFQDKGIEHLQVLADAAIRMAQSCAENRNKTVGEIRLANIRKLIERYPEGFVLGGGKR